MKQLKEFIILSAELSTLSSKENFDRTFRLESFLIDLRLDYKVIKGVYKGSEETSFLVTVKNEDEIETVKDLGLVTFDQESILFRNLQGKAQLIFKDGSNMHLGVFKKVNNVENVENYSVVDGEYWLCG